MSGSLLDSIRVDVIRRLQELSSEESKFPVQLEDFLRMARELPSDYHEQIVELIHAKASEIGNSQPEFDHKMLHYYLIDYLSIKSEKFKWGLKKVLSTGFASEIANAGGRRSQLEKLIELFCKWEVPFPNEALQTLEQAYIKTNKRVT